MKAKKALKRLRRVEELLSIVIDEFAGNEPRVREFLDSAKRSVIRAKGGINSLSDSGNVKKEQSKAKQAKRSSGKGSARRKRGAAATATKRKNRPGQRKNRSRRRLTRA